MRFKKSPSVGTSHTFTISIIFLLVVIQYQNAEALQGAFSGDVTWYTEWAWNYGSCGLDISMENPFYVAALSRKYMILPPGMTNPNLHPLCGPTYCLQIHGERGSIIVKVSDTCWDCVEDDVDVADAVYVFLDDPLKGRVRMSWDWVNCLENPPGRIW